MNWLIIKNDLKRNKAINLILTLFIVFSTVLATLSVIVGAQTFSSINELYKVAQPPHFLQMHKGEIDQNKIDDFMQNYEGVDYWQTVTMIDIFAENLTIIKENEKYNLADFRLDIGLVKQNETRDLLLNSKHQKLNFNKGEIGLPVILKEMYNLKIGDQIILSNGEIIRHFVIKDFIIDSQMNSSLASSTRILLSNEDFDFLSGKIGEYEYLIEVYFNNKDDASVFKTAYENAGLPQNGQAVTYMIIFILSAFTDIVTVFVLSLMSILLILVSFICVKFTIMAALEEEIGEIGTMKAIGVPFKEIRGLYLNKYRLLSGLGVVIGYLLAIAISGIFTKHISTTFGDLRISSMVIMIALFAALLIYALTIIYCKNILRKINKLSVVDALVSGKGFGKELKRIKSNMQKYKNIPVDWMVALNEVIYQFKQWIIVFSIIVIATLMILVPNNLTNTFGSPKFITYMGSSLEDILIEVDNGANLEQGYENVKKTLNGNQAIENYYEYKTIRIQTIDKDNKIKNIDIDSGDYAGNELKYLNGNAPKDQNEIALSYLNSNETGFLTGDLMEVSFNGETKKFIVSGVYQDVTSGGYTAKSKYDFTGVEANKYTFSVNLKDNIDIENEAKNLSKILGLGIKVEPMKEFIHQTLGGVEKQLRMINYVVILISGFLSILIVVLFLKLRLARDLSSIAIFKAIGFSEKDIRKQYLIKIGIVGIIGTLSGLLITNFLGEKIVNIALEIAGIGIKEIEFIVNPIDYIIYPTALVTLILISSWKVLGIIKKYNIISIINE